MARLDNNSSLPPETAERRLDGYWLAELNSPKHAGLDNRMGGYSAGAENSGLELLPFYNAQSSLERQVEPDVIDDAPLLPLPGGSAAFLPVPAQRTDLDALRRLLELDAANDRLAAMCARWESRAVERLARLEAIGHAMETMCHALTEDLRAPLRWIAGFSELLRSEKAAAPDSLGNDYLERITKAARHMERLIQDLQTYGRMNLEAAASAPVSIETCVCTVLGEYTEAIGTRLAEVSVEPPLPFVQGDARLLHTVFAQLIDNALKFAVPGTPPRIQIRARSEPAIVRIYVEDDGVGIPASQCEQIFGLFKRLGDTQPGTGVGLALVRKAMEQMGGRAGVESQPGKGSRFWIELPTTSK